MALIKPPPNSRVELELKHRDDWKERPLNQFDHVLLSYSERWNIHRLITSAQETDTWVKHYMVNSKGKCIGAAGK